MLQKGNIGIADDVAGVSAVGADKVSVEIVIESVKKVVDIAKQSGVEVNFWDAGGVVAHTDGPRVLTYKQEIILEQINYLVNVKLT